MKPTNLFIRVGIAVCLAHYASDLSSGAEPLTNAVPITHNLYFQLKKMFGPLTNQFPANEFIEYEILTTATNHGVAYRYFPPDRSFVFKLLSPSGTEVKRTKRGLEYSKPPNVPRTMRESSRLHLYDASLTRSLFRPNDMFVLTNRGVYELEISIRLWVQTTNKGAPNELSELTQPGIGTNFQFGVVTSPPVRVKIIKE